MPNLKYPEMFHLNASAAFDARHAAGTAAPHNGIYRCGCGHELPSLEGSLLSSEPHPLHPPGEPIVWTLVAAARRNDAAAPLAPTDFRNPAGWPPAAR